MAWPINSNVNTDILHDDFYSSIERAQANRFYSRLSVAKQANEVVNVFASLGSVPEIRQMSGITGGGNRQAVMLKDWTVTATMLEWEQTIYERRIICESKPDEIRAKTTQMAAKAMKGMDKTLCQALISTTALGYDGIALFSASHPESGSNQTNTSSTVAATGTLPTAAEIETAMNTAVGQMKQAQDDQGTPVNEGVSRYVFLCHPLMEYAARTAFSPLMSNQAVDTSGVTGRFRGLVDVIVSAYCTTTGLPGGTVDRAFLFAQDADEQALALVTLSDWQFNSNIGNESSDDWNNGQGYIRSWAAFAYVPWQWQAAQQLIWT